MSGDKLRRELAHAAARLMYTRRESDYSRARIRAARQVSRTWVPNADLPSDAEIRDELQRLDGIYEGDHRFESLREMRLDALRVMRLLHHFQPLLTGPLIEGEGGPCELIEIHLVSPRPEAVTSTLEYAGFVCDVRDLRVWGHGDEERHAHVIVQDRFNFAITCFPDRHSLHGVAPGEVAIQRADVVELEMLIGMTYPGLDLSEERDDDFRDDDRFRFYRTLLTPLEHVDQNRQRHPEGDALYHSLQVFELVREEEPYDEELLLAALLHDVGKAIDPYDHVTVGLAVLQPHITDRAAWFIANHTDGARLLEGTLGARARRRLQAHADYERLLLLAKSDRDGRVPGAQVSDLDEVLDYLRAIDRLCG
ncbi:MAG: HD domain-containing protein [Maioricimonas sp. JB049]